MTDNEIRDVILEAAYNKAKDDGTIEAGGRFTVYEISKLNGLERIEKNRIDFNIDYLEKDGLIKWAIIGKVAITIMGVDYYERTHPEVLLVIPKEDTLSDNEIRDVILEVAYKEKRDGKSEEGGRFNVYEISKLEGLGKNRINFNADYSDKKNLVKWTTGRKMIITIGGIKKYERIHKHE
jgi:hypothetical protein